MPGQLSVEINTVTVDGGVITIWRDYFDPADFTRQLGLILNDADATVKKG
jgi:limonene-1,2-epoxide hydrolase